MHLFLAISLCVSLVFALPVSVDEDSNPEESGFFEGDIEIEPGEEPYLKNAVANHNLLWPHGVVPYTIDAAHQQHASHVQVFHDAMNEIMEKTKVNGKKCIDFPKHTSSSGGAYIQFTYGSGCHTPIGYHSNRRSAVTLGNGCLRKGTVMHEILHSLGFWHEQSRADRDSYVTINWSNIQKGHTGNFNKYQLGFIDHLNMPYDYGSVMHYPAYAFAVDRHKMTIIPKQSGVTIGQRVRLSDIDAKEIQILYGCIPRPGSGAVTTVAPGGTHVTPLISHITTPHGHISNHAATCTFDRGLCGWLQSTHDNIDWRTGTGSTPSRRTGPHQDHDGNSGGHYLFLEASGNTNKNAIIISPTYTTGTYCFSAWYNMYGHDMGYLYFEILVGGRKHALRSFHGDHGDKWLHFQSQVNIRGSTPFQFQIEGRVGASYHSDMAVDDVSVTPGACSHG